MKKTILAGILAVAGTLGAMAQTAPPKGPAAKSKAEMDAVQAMVAAQGNPDGLITAAEALLTKFADTEFKDVALFLEATAYQAKGDSTKAQLFAENAFTANPSNFQAALMLSQNIVQHTRPTDLDREDKLTKVDKYGKAAIDILATAAKPNPQITDQQWEDYRKDLTAQAHDTLGMAALTRKKYDQAVTEFKAAVDGAAHVEPAYEVRLASAYQSAGKYDEAIAIAEKVMAEAQAPTQVKQVAQAVRAGAVVAKQKASGQSPAPAPPAQVEIKK